MVTAVVINKQEESVPRYHTGYVRSAKLAQFVDFSKKFSTRRSKQTLC
jgi:hypothetical protein